MRRRTVVLLCAALSGVWLGARATVGSCDSKITVTAEPVSATADGVKQAAFSDNGLHVAYVGPAGSRWAAFVDGKSGNKYDEISTFGNLSPQKQFIFGADGSHCAYAARKGQDTFVVVDGREMALGQEAWTVTEALFSADGNRFAVAVNPQHAPARVILDGKDQPNHLAVKSLVFSSGGKHFAYVANDSVRYQNIYTVVVDGQAGPQFENILGLTASRDGDHWGYIGQRAIGTAAGANSTGPGPTDGKSHLVIDGKDFSVMDDVTAFQFTPDGQHVMYFGGKAQAGKKDGDGRQLYDTFICLDGQQWPYSPRVSSQAGLPVPQLSMDGKRIAYVETSVPGQQGKGAVVTVNGERGLEYESISQLQFSADGQHLVYLAEQGLNKYGAGGRAFVVYDGNESDAYPTGQLNGMRVNIILMFSPDGKHLAYTARDDTHAFVVEDGKKGAEYDVVPLAPVFSPDSAHLAYFASKDVLKNLPPLQRQQAESAPNFDPGNYVVVDGQEERLALHTNFGGGAIHFSPDGKHMAYAVSGRPGGGISKLMVDGQVVKFTDSTVTVNSQADLTLQFSPDSKHIVYQGYSARDGIQCMGVDGDLVGGYSVAAFSSSSPLVGFVEGGKLQYFAHQGMVGPLQRVTVDLGAERDFGTVAAAAAANPPAATPAANSDQQNNAPPQNNSTASGQQQPAPVQNNNNSMDSNAQQAQQIFGGMFHPPRHH